MPESTRVASATYPPNLSSPEAEHLAEVVKDWAVAHGLAVRPPASVIAGDLDPLEILATNVAVTLFPSAFPKSCFDEAKAVQKAYNELYAAISRDEEFLEQIVREVIDGDTFIASLWGVHMRVKREGYTQPLSLGLFRSDYMVHKDPVDADGRLQIKQVEFNTIASSFGGLSSQAASLHRFLANTEYPMLEQAICPGSMYLPPNDNPVGLARGLAAAFHAYGPSELGLDKCVVFLVQNGERNIFDQRHLEYAVKEQPTGSGSPIPVFRLPFGSIASATSLSGAPRRQLLYRLPQRPQKVFEVAVVYLRAGYGPQDYPDNAAWESRLHIERSAAIKCPTILTQLAGTKKVQQVLATPPASRGSSPKTGGNGPSASSASFSSSSLLRRFVPPELSATMAGVGRTFANMYPLDDATESGRRARRLAMDADMCRRYVLKPQREGGGNNIYRGAIPPFLRSLPESHWKSFILMELITPPPVRNVILRNGALEQGGVICELGIYGACLWNHHTREVLHNEEAGYLLRTKGDQSEEGGVAAGFGCMDSCCLV